MLPLEYVNPNGSPAVIVRVTVRVGSGRRSAPWSTNRVINPKGIAEAKKEIVKA